MSVDVQPLNPSAITVDKNYAVILLHEFGKATPYMTPGKIVELWNEFKVHDVLFSDIIRGDIEAFIDILVNPSSVWFEIFSLEKNKPIGIGNIRKVILGYDAQGHFAFWDSRATGREAIIKSTMKWAMDRYKLHRLSAEIPAYQSGTIRFTERIGFVREGTRREGVFKDGSWIDLYMFGLLRSELEKDSNGIS